MSNCRVESMALFFALTFFLFLSATSVLAGETESDSTFALGKRLYHEGIAVDGTPVKATSQYDINVSGKSAACVKCHRPSGFGASEGGYYVPPITAPLLFAPRQLDRTRLFPDMFQQVQPPTFSARLHQPHMRPAYTTESLSVTLRTGRDAGGQELAAIMPRYELTEEDVVALTAYLKTLSSELSPGVDDRGIHFVMVMSDNVPASDRDPVLQTMRMFVDWHNRHLRNDRARPNFSPFHRSQFVPLERYWEFSVLTLTGENETWQKQVEDFYQANPFFAIVSGLVRGSWSPISEFCDRHNVPCLLPITDLPVAGVEKGYSVYFSEGLTLEAKVLADYVLNTPPTSRRIFQLAADDPFGQIPSHMLRDRLTAGRPDISHDVKVYHDIAKLSLMMADVSRQLAKDDVLVIWPGADASFAVNTVMQQPPSTGLIVLPSRAISLTSTVQDKDFLDRLRFVEPHEITVTKHPRSFVVRAWMRTRGLDISKPTLQFETFYALSLLEAALMNMREDYYRDYLIERIERESEKDLNPGIYPRLALGPTQRFASKGAFIVRLDPAQPSRLIAVSDWIVP
ncbi:MAG: c-type cytochrome [Nitrospirota bacterium]|nr:c-type cytochrome [Nitrospirota bacterium]